MTIIIFKNPKNNNGEMQTYKQTPTLLHTFKHKYIKKGTQQET